MSAPAMRRARGALVSMVVVTSALSAHAQSGPATGAPGGGSMMVPRAGGAVVPTPIAGSGASPTTPTGSAPGAATGMGPTVVPGPGGSATQFPFQRDPSLPHFTLDQALRAMARAHPQLLAAQASTDAARYDLRDAGLWTNPQLNLNYTHSLATPTQNCAGMPGCSTNSQAYASIGYINGGLSQLLELSNLPGARRRSAEYTLEATRNDGEATRRGLVFDVYTAFVTLTATSERLEILRDAASQLEHANQIVQARVAAGASPHYDASRISIALADARAAVADAEADLEAARGDFDVAVGPYAGTLRGLPQFDLYNLPPLEPLTGLVDRMHNRPDILAARQRAQAAGAQIDVARRSVFQGVTVFVGAAVGTTPVPQGYSGQEVDGTLGVTIPLPVVDRGQGAIPAAQYRAQSAAFTANALQLSAEQRVMAVRNEVVRRRMALGAYRDAGVAQSAGMRREAEAGYREGRLSVLELVDAYNSYRDALLRLVSLASDARTAEVNLGRASGLVP